MPSYLKIALFMILYTVYNNLVCGQMLGKNTEKFVPYNRDWNLGVMFHTNGLGIEYQNSKSINLRWSRLYEFDLMSIRNPKELRLNNPSHQESTPYVFGKLNGFYAFDGIIGVRYNIAERLANQGVKININLGAGPSVGLIKPIYYHVSQPDNTDPVYKKFDVNDDKMQADIIGQGPFSKGLNETGFIAGATVKSSFSFEWGAFEHKFFGLETGIQMHAYPAEVPIFAFIKNDRVYVNLFATLSFGFRKE